MIESKSTYGHSYDAGSSVASAEKRCCRESFALWETCKFSAVSIFLTFKILTGLDKRFFSDYSISARIFSTSDVISFNQAKSKMLTSVFRADIQQTCRFRSRDEGTQLVLPRISHCSRTFDVLLFYFPVSFHLVFIEMVFIYRSMFSLITVNRMPDMAHFDCIN